MKKDESIHITVKRPPDPNPVKTIGIFSDPDDPAIKGSIDHFLNKPFEPKSEEFTQNVKDEVMKLLMSHKVVAVARKGTQTLVYFNES